MSYYGINFRSTSGYVTDGANDTYCIGDVYPTTRGGKTFGWASSIGGQVRDRTTGYDVRLAGINYIVNNVTPKTFTWDLPNGPGNYRLRIALGDAGSGNSHKIVVKDGTTTLVTIEGATQTGEFYDASGTLRGATAWPANNVIAEVEFAGDYLTFELGRNNAGSDGSCIAHIALEHIAPSFKPAWAVGTTQVAH